MPQDDASTRAVTAGDLAAAMGILAEAIRAVKGKVDTDDLPGPLPMPHLRRTVSAGDKICPADPVIFCPGPWESFDCHLRRWTEVATLRELLDGGLALAESCRAVLAGVPADRVVSAGGTDAS